MIRSFLFVYTFYRPFDILFVFCPFFSFRWSSRAVLFVLIFRIALISNNLYCHLTNGISFRSRIIKISDVDHNLTIHLAVLQHMRLRLHVSKRRYSSLSWTNSFFRNIYFLTNYKGSNRSNNKQVGIPETGRFKCSRVLCEIFYSYVSIRI